MNPEEQTLPQLKQRLAMACATLNSLGWHEGEDGVWKKSESPESTLDKIKAWPVGTVGQVLTLQWKWIDPPPEWKLPDPPPGTKWHRDDWTQEMLPEGYRPLLLGEKAENGDEWLFSGDAYKCSFREPAKASDHRTRTRRPMPKPKTKRPLTPDDVPAGCEFRHIQKTIDRHVPVVIDNDGCTFLDFYNPSGEGPRAEVDWPSLCNWWQMRRPGDADWRPCWVEE
jgi:hypothetical protein